METSKTKKKKIKGQIPGTHYAWLVANAQKRRCQVSEALEELITWLTEVDRMLPTPFIDCVKSAQGSHTYLNFNADERLLRRWERFKRINKIKGDSHAIRVAVNYCYGLASISCKKAPTRNGKPILQKEFMF